MKKQFVFSDFCNCIFPCSPVLAAEENIQCTYYDLNWHKEDAARAYIYNEIRHDITGEIDFYFDDEVVITLSENF